MPITITASGSAIVPTIDEFNALVSRVETLEAGKRLVGVHGNQNFSELLTSIPITTGSPYDYKILFSQEVADIQAGDVFDVSCEFQVNTSYSHNVMVASWLHATPSATDIAGGEVCEANGQNINLDIHHYARTRAGVWVAPANYASRFFNLIIYSASTAASPGDELTVSQDYGRLAIKQYR